MDQTPGKPSSPIKRLEPYLQPCAAVIVAVIGLCGTLVAAYLGWLGIRTQIERPLQATQTAELRSILPPTQPSNTGIQPTPPAAQAAAQNGAQSSGTPSAIPPPAEPAIRLAYNPLMWAFTPRLLPDDITPDLGAPTNLASSQLDAALQSEQYKNWPMSPRVFSDFENQVLSLELDVTGLGSNTEWVKIPNQMRLTVFAQPVAKELTLVVVTGAGGAGEERVAAKPVVLSTEYDRFSVEVEFPAANFFTLQPGEIESFVIPMQCTAPGIYQISVEMPYTYQGKAGLEKYADIPTVICPDGVNMYYWEGLETGFYSHDEFEWNGETYQGR
jgi:hypothetical protein